MKMNKQRLGIFNFWRIKDRKIMKWVGGKKLHKSTHKASCFHSFRRYLFGQTDQSMCGLLLSLVLCGDGLHSRYAWARGSGVRRFQKRSQLIECRYGITVHLRDLQSKQNDKSVVFNWLYSLLLIRSTQKKWTKKGGGGGGGSEGAYVNISFTNLHQIF